MKTKYPRSHAPVGHVFKEGTSRVKSTGSPAARVTRPSCAGFKPISFGPLANTTIQLSNILVAIDFSDESRKAVQYAAAFARQSGASITALHVADAIDCQADYGYGPVARTVPNVRLVRKARRRLMAMSKSLLISGLRLITVVRSGVACEEIVQAARDLDTDLIVIGTRGDGNPDRRPIGSTAERVVRHAPCPVLVVRKKENEFVWCRKSR